MKALGLLIVLIFWLIVGLIQGLQTFLKWRKSGYCNHDFRIHRTNSFGQEHWYKCQKCSEERLR